MLRPDGGWLDAPRRTVVSIVDIPEYDCKVIVVIYRIVNLILGFVKGSVVVLEMNQKYVDEKRKEEEEGEKRSSFRFPSTWVIMNNKVGYCPLNRRRGGGM